MTRLYGIKDNKIAMTDVFMSSNNACAIRFFTDIVNNEKTMISKHPEDYALYCLGEIDDAGNIKPELTMLEQAINLR